MDYPNSGSLFPSTVRKSEKSPDFWGSIKIDKAYLKDLISRSEDNVEIKLSGWKREAKATGNKFLSLAVDTYVAGASAPAPKQEEADPWA